MTQRICLLLLAILMFKTPITSNKIIFNQPKHIYKWAPGGEVEPYEIQESDIVIKEEDDPYSILSDYKLMLTVKEPIALIIKNSYRHSAMIQMGYDDGVVYVSPSRPYVISKINSYKEHQTFETWFQFYQKCYNKSKWNMSYSLRLPKYPDKRWRIDQMFGVILNNAEVMNGVYRKNYLSQDVEGPKYVDAEVTDLPSANDAMSGYPDYVKEVFERIMEKYLLRYFKENRERAIEEMAISTFRHGYEKSKEGIFKEMNEKMFDVNNEQIFHKWAMLYEDTLKNEYNAEGLESFWEYLRGMKINLLIRAGTDSWVENREVIHFKSERPEDSPRMLLMWEQVARQAKKLYEQKINKAHEEAIKKLEDDPEFTEYFTDMTNKLYKLIKHLGKFIEEEYEVKLTEQVLLDLRLELYKRFSIRQHLNKVLYQVVKGPLEEFAKKYVHYSVHYTMLTTLGMDVQAPATEEEIEAMVSGQNMAVLGLIGGIESVESQNDWDLYERTEMFELQKNLLLI